jgi:hypothetical protein
MDPAAQAAAMAAWQAQYGAQYAACELSYLTLSFRLLFEEGTRRGRGRKGQNAER